MFKFWFCAIAGIVLLAGTTVFAQNDTFLHSVEDLVLHFPRYLENALSLDDESLDLEDESNHTNYLFEKHRCSRDLLRIFTGLKQKKMWAIRGMKIIHNVLFSYETNECFKV